MKFSSKGKKPGASLPLGRTGGRQAALLPAWECFLVQEFGRVWATVLSSFNRGFVRALWGLQWWLSLVAEPGRSSGAAPALRAVGVSQAGTVCASSARRVLGPTQVYVGVKRHFLMVILIPEVSRLLLPFCKGVIK